MKKILSIIFVILVLPLLGAGCSIVKQDKAVEQQKKIEDLSKNTEEVQETTSSESSASTILYTSTTAPKINEAQASKIICTSWEYTAWGVCNQNNEQVRYIIVSYPKGCVVGSGSPVIVKTCGVEEPIPSQQAQQNKTKSTYSKEEANAQVTSFITSIKESFENGRRKILATLLAADMTTETNINNRLKTLAVFKLSRDTFVGQSYVADFFYNYAKNELEKQLDDVERIKAASYLIDGSIDKILIEYDQIAAKGAPTLDVNALNLYLRGIMEQNFKNEDIFDGEIDKQSKNWDAISSEYFSFIKNYFNDIYDYLSGSKFFGYSCSDKCVGHEAGWLWASNKKINSLMSCDGNSQSFIEGCYVYVKQTNP